MHNVTVLVERATYNCLSDQVVDMSEPEPESEKTRRKEPLEVDMFQSLPATIHGVQRDVAAVRQTIQQLRRPVRRFIRGRFLGLSESEED